MHRRVTSLRVTLESCSLLNTMRHYSRMLTSSTTSSQLVQTFLGATSLRQFSLIVTTIARQMLLSLMPSQVNRCPLTNPNWGLPMRLIAMTIERTITMTRLNVSLNALKSRLSKDWERLHWSNSTTDPLTWNYCLTEIWRMTPSDMRTELSLENVSKDVLSRTVTMLQLSPKREENRGQIWRVTLQHHQVHPTWSSSMKKQVIWKL